MDEILIEEKKYVSSKRAAKVTGYAKDYVGQLCREGRVPARLVGRSWYVLESAIHDHRFGEHTTEQDVPVAVWESPRYEASPVETVSLVNRLQEPQPDNIETTQTQHLQDSWKAWFDRVTDTQTETKQEENSVAEVEPERVSPEDEVVNQVEVGEGVQVPIHTIYDLPPEDLLPSRYSASTTDETIKDEDSPLQIQKKEKNRVIRGIQVSSIVFAVVLAVLAGIGTGYFDDYIISANRDNIFAGVIFYNK